MNGQPIIIAGEAMQTVALPLQHPGTDVRTYVMINGLI